MITDLAAQIAAAASAGSTPDLQPREAALDHRVSTLDRRQAAT
jgi:hypothetical protein